MTWDILAVLVTAVGAVGTWWAFTRRGAVAGMRALGWTLLVPAAWLTGVFALVGRIVTAVTRWTSSIVLSLGFWTGIGLGGLAIALILLAAVLRGRGVGAAPGSAAEAPVTSSAPRREVRAPRSARAEAPVTEDDGLGDIEELLRRRGIE